MKEQYKLEVETGKPTIPYRETIISKGEGHCRHKKQTGGAGQFGEVYLRKDIMKNQRITQNLFDNDEVASLIEQAEKEIPYFGSYNDMPFRVKVG